EVVRHGALADLFAEERDDISAGPDRQDVPIPYRLDEPVQRPGENERVDDEVEARIHHHQQQPGKPANVGEHAGHVADERETVSGGGAVEPVIQKREARGGDEQKGGSAQQLRGAVGWGRRRRDGFGHGWDTSACDRRSCSSVTDSGVSVTPSSTSAFLCTVSSDVMTSITVGVMPPFRVHPAMVALTLASQTGS